MLGKRNEAFYCASVLGVFVVAYCWAFSIEQGPGFQKTEEKINVPDEEVQHSMHHYVVNITGEQEQEQEQEQEREPGGLDSTIDSDEGDFQRKSFHSQKNAFRFVLEEGDCRLLSIEKISGNFRQQRGYPNLHPGIIVCKLVASNGEVIAEERVHIPDHLCRLSKPVSGKNTNKVNLIDKIGPIVFQVRLPVKGGERLDVYRVTKTLPVTVEALMLSVPIKK